MNEHVKTVYIKVPQYIKANEVEPGDRITFSTRNPQPNYQEIVGIFIDVDGRGIYRTRDAWGGSYVKLYKNEFISTYAEIESIEEESEETDADHMDHSYITLCGKFFSKNTNEWSSNKYYKVMTDLDVLLLERKMK